MKKSFLILAVVAVVIGATLFYDQVLAIFHGMSALEAMQTIVTFVLHVMVVTILSYVAFTLPEIFKPWLQALRWKRRAVRRNRGAQKIQGEKQKASRLTTDQIVKYLMAQTMSKPRRDVPAASPQDDIHLNF